MTDDVTRLRPSFYDFEARERECRESAILDLAEPLVLANAATGCLAHLAWHLEVPESPVDPMPTRVAQRAAVLGLTLIGIRTSRALILLVRCGWEVEAHGLKRRLTESRLRVQHIEGDESGEAARQWLDGRGVNANTLAARFNAKDPWALFSSGSHADVRSLRLTMVPPPWTDAGQRGPSGMVTPHRDRQHGLGLLLDTASDAVVLMGHLATVFGRRVGVDAEFRERLTYARAAFADTSAVMTAARERAWDRTQR